LDCLESNFFFFCKDAAAAGPQIVNPPYIHALDMTEDGNYILAAAGDGTLQLFNLYLKDRIGLADRAHESATTFAFVLSVTQLTIKAQRYCSNSCFANFGRPYSNALSGGNDGTLAWWSVTFPPAEELKSYVQYKRAAQVNASAKRSKKKTQQAAPSPPPAAEIKLKMRLTTGKVNCIATTREVTPVGNVFIADETNDISAYTFPITN